MDLGKGDLWVLHFSLGDATTALLALALGATGSVGDALVDERNVILLVLLLWGLLWRLSWRNHNLWRFHR